MTKKWVYESLVQNDRDAVGLIAYALYKERKHNLAKSLREEGNNEADIQARVETFHDQTLQSKALDDYRDRATEFLDRLVSQMENGIRQHYEKQFSELEKKAEKEKADLKKKFTKDLKSHKASFLRQVKAYQIANRGVFERLWSWLISGIPSTLSSIFLTCLMLGGMLFMVDKQDRNQVLLSFLAKYFSSEKETASAAHKNPTSTQARAGSKKDSNGVL